MEHKNNERKYKIHVTNDKQESQDHLFLNLRLPEMFLQIHMAIGLESDIRSHVL